MGFGTKQVDITDIKDKTDNLPSSPADEDTLDEIKTRGSPYDLWSNTVEVTDGAHLTITNSSTDRDLPSIVMAGLPTNASIIRAIVMAKFAAKKDTSGSDNYCNGAQAIQIQKAVGGTLLTAILFGTYSLETAGGIKEGGDVPLGAYDIKTQIPENGSAMSFQWTASKVLANNLIIYELQVGVRIWYQLS